MTSEQNSQYTPGHGSRTPTELRFMADTIHQTLQQRQIPQNLIDLIVPAIRPCSGQAPPPGAPAEAPEYHSLLIEKLHTWSANTHADPQQELHGVLIAMNFNSGEYFDYYLRYMSQHATDRALSYSDNLQHLLDLRTLVIQLTDTPVGALEPKFDLLSNRLLKWLDAATEALRHRIQADQQQQLILLNPGSDRPYYIHCSVPQLGCMLRVLRDMKFIQMPLIPAFCQKIAALFSTKRAANPSPNQIQKAFEGPDRDCYRDVDRLCDKIKFYLRERNLV